MAKKIHYEPSRTLMEFRLLPGLTSPESAVNKVSLKTPMVFSEGLESQYYLNLPLVSAAMQSVSGAKMGIELAKLGGLAFIYCSQAIKTQAEMVGKIKNYKAGFVEAKTITPDTTILKLSETSKKLGFSTFPVVDENNVLLGIIRKYDYDKQAHANLFVKDRMIPISNYVVGTNIYDLHQANKLLIDSHQSVLPIVDQAGKLSNVVFRKDIQDHLHNPLQLVDKNKRLFAAAAINTHDYKDRVDALAEAQVDVILLILLMDTLFIKVKYYVG
jgi:IMP dehydrogenase